MEYDNLIGLDKPISKIGFGCWGIGGEAYGKTDDNTSVDALLTAINNGINFFDTSPTYGRSESVLSHILKDRDKLVIASKYEIQNDPQKSVESSLKSLCTEYVDLLQLHSPDMNLVTYDEINKLEKLVKLGLIKTYGISVKSPSDTHKAILLGFRNIQINFSLIDQRAIDENLFQYNCKYIARTPLCFGLLNDNITKDSLPLLDHRRNLPDHIFKSLNDGGRYFAEEIKSSTEIKDSILMALRFCLSFSRVVTVIPGMLSTEQVEHNYQTINYPKFDSSLLSKLYKIYKDHYYVSNTK